MMGDVALRRARGVDAGQRPDQPVLDQAGQAAAQRRGAAILPPGVGADQVDQVADIAPLDDDPPVHIGLGGMEMRVARDEAGDARIGEADRDRREIGIGGAVGPSCPVGEDHRHFAALEQAADELVE